VQAVYAWRANYSCTQTSSFLGLVAASGTQMTRCELEAVVVLILMMLGEVVEPFEAAYYPKEKNRLIVAVRCVATFCHFSHVSHL
jgi:hypothetical protein